MYYTLNHFPNIDKTKINTFRKKYDPCFNFIDAHIPLVFPISDSGVKKALINHIEDKLKNWQQLIYT